MRKHLFVSALGIAVSLAGCGAPQPQAPTEGFQTMSHTFEGIPFGFFRELRPSDRHRCLEAPLPAVPPRAGLPEASSCTVTGSGNIAVDAFGRVVAFTVNVTQPAVGSPTGTLTLSQTIQPPFNLQSSSITSVVCFNNSTTITGTLVGGGTFRLNGTDYLVGPDYVEVFTPYYVAGGPVVNGGITITGGTTLPGQGLKPGLPHARFVCPPNSIAR